MGQGGTFVLINGTPYVWSQSQTSHSYQMNSWSFPSSINPGLFVVILVNHPLTCSNAHEIGQMCQVYVEWDQSIGKKQSDDGGEVYYSLSGTSYTFQLHARAPGGNFSLQAYFDAISTPNNPQGSILNLGWHHDGNTIFILSGASGHFSSVHPPSNWMQSNISTLGPRPLKHVCMPGSHDAGMNVLDGTTAFATAENTQTQTVSIANQLLLGARYFDLRPVIASGQYKTGHYSDLDVVGWQGADGQSFAQIIDQLNSFMASNHELIILNLSHAYNTDVGRDYRVFNQDEWTALFQQMSAIQYLFASTTSDFTTLPLSQFIGNGQAAVAVIVQPDSSIPNFTFGPYANQGFYLYSAFNVYNNYADVDNLSDMSNDQLGKMRTVRTSPDAQSLLLSWTLTQAAGDIVGGISILDLANMANSAIFTELPPAISKTTYPNILFIDNFDSSDITALAMAVNDLVN